MVSENRDMSKITVRKIKTDKVSANFVYQILYQITILGIPLVLAPYLTRILGDMSLGIYTYSYTIASYFVLIAMLGIERHGQRVIAETRDNETEFRKVFWSLLTVHFIFSVLALAIYYFYCIFISEDRQISLLLSLYVLSALFDVTWLFKGLENFKRVVIRNLLIKLFETLCIFIFVKSVDDLWKYTFIKSLSVLLGQAIMIPQAVLAVKPIRFSANDMKKHLQPLFFLFVLKLAVTLYTVFDKVLLGTLSAKANVAYYEYSYKIINIPQMIAGIICTVLFPRACVCASRQNVILLKKYVKYSMLFTYFVSFAAIFGIMGVGSLFARIYYGTGFEICGNIMKLMSFLTLIVGLGDVVRSNYLYPYKRDRLSIIIIVGNAIVNLVLSIWLIPLIGVYGAVLGTLSAECFGLLLEMYFSRSILPIREVIRNAIPFLVNGIVMYVVIQYCGTFIQSEMIRLLIQILFGGSIYCILCVGYLYLFEKNIFLKMMSWLRPRKSD